jgi:WhiB family transcriptional regulator, redox-sensing transcriptional regulator
MDLEWMGSAKCRDLDPELFFPLSEIDPATETAIEHCVQCPVMIACDAAATWRGERWGVWGGKFRGSDRSAARRREYRERIERDPGYLARLAKRQAAYRRRANSRSSVDSPTASR